MTEIVPFHPPAPSGTSLELAPEAWKLACRVAGTEFVPKGLRGKPEAVLACILAGHEAGLSPMTSLRQIYVVDGRPAMAAELMRALVLRAGHELWTEESTSTRAIVCGSRSGSARESRVAWTEDDARRAGLLGKDNWKKYPRAMLLARATTELCRMIFPDVLAGISHSIEEIADGGVEDVGPLEHLGAPEVSDAPAEPAPQTARARRAATSPTTAQEAPVEHVPDRTRGEVPDLPGEAHTAPQDDESDIVDAEIVEPADEGIPLTPEEAQQEADQQDAEYAPPADETDWDDGSDEYPPLDDPPPPEQGRPLTGPAMIATKLNNRGIRDRARKIRIVEGIVGHAVESTNDLTSDETAAVIRYLDELPEDAVLLDGDDDDPAPETPTRTTAVTPPEEWNGDRWREFLRQRKVKVAPAMKAAQQIGAAQDPPVTVGTLDDLAGSGICSELVGWIEDNAS